MTLPLRGPELLTEAHDVAGFDCGNAALNRFLHRYAQQNQRNQSARTYVALRGETLCQAAGRWYAVMNAQYTGDAREPDGLYCLTGLTQGQPGCADYYAVQNAKLKKYRLGLPDGAEKDAVGALIAELDRLAAG